MKSTFLKAVLVLIVVFGTISIYAQEQKKAVEVEWDQKPLVQPRIDPLEALMRPRWIIPYVKVDSDNNLYIRISNTGRENVRVHIELYDEAGTIIKVEGMDLEGRKSTYTNFFDVHFPEWEGSFTGYIEVSASSPFVYVAPYTSKSVLSSCKKEKSIIINIPVQVFRIEP